MLAVFAVVAAVAGGQGIRAARAASPTSVPSPTPVASSDTEANPGSGDVRTTPSAPGLVGDPLFAVGGVIVVAAVTVAATLVAMRLERGRS